MSGSTKALAELKRPKSPADMGDGYYLHRTGMDANGNHSAWVSKGANRAKKVQTNNVHLQAVHGKDVEDIMSSPEAIKQLKAHFESIEEASKGACCCSDPGCPGAKDTHGKGSECGKPATMHLDRIDMGSGKDRMPFCDKCGSDALDSGVFKVQESKGRDSSGEAPKKEGMMHKTKPVSEKAFHGIANAAIRLMVAIKESPRTGQAKPLLARLDKVANSAVDAIAAGMVGEDVTTTYEALVKDYNSVAGKIGEGWLMFPALGVGNDFNAGSDGGAMGPDSGVEPIEGMASALPAAPGKNESVEDYVGRIIKEESSSDSDDDSGCACCGSKSHDADDCDCGAHGEND